MLQAQILENRAVVALGGPEARDFLQGLITNDIGICREGQALYTALLTPQGKILFDFFLVAQDESGFLIDCAAMSAGDLLKRLTMYRLRSKVEITPRSDLVVVAFWGEGVDSTVAHDGLAFRDPRLDTMGVRAIGRRDALETAIRAYGGGNYEAHRLALGIPDSVDLPADTVFALDAGLEELNGVSFKKGCYVGQEVTSRMKHRASARRRFLISEIGGDAPVFGTPVEAQGRVLGEWASAQGGHGLALVRLDRVAEAEAANAPITSQGRSVRLTKPSWIGV